MKFCEVYLVWSIFDLWQMTAFSKVIISNSFRVSLDSVKTPIVVFYWWIEYKLNTTHWETIIRICKICHYQPSLCLLQLHWEPLPKKRVRFVEDYSCLEVCLEYHLYSLPNNGLVIVIKEPSNWVSDKWNSEGNFFITK